MACKDGTCNGGCTSCALANLKTRYPQLQGSSAMNPIPNCGAGQLHAFEHSPPTFHKRNGGTYCIDVSQPNCDAQNPVGGRIQPLVLEALPAYVGPGDPVVTTVRIYSTTPATIVGIAFYEVLANSNKADLGPTGVRIGQWSTGRDDQMFPGYGRNSETTGGVAQQLGTQKAGETFRPITLFTDEQLAELGIGYNNLPPTMAALDISNTETGFEFGLTTRKLIDIDLGLNLYIAYNASLE